MRFICSAAPSSLRCAPSANKLLQNEGNLLQNKAITTTNSEWQEVIGSAILISSAFEVPYRLLSQSHLPQRSLNHVTHQLFSLQPRTHLLVLVDKDLDLIEELSVHEFIFCNESQYLVDLHVEIFIFVEAGEVILPEPLLFGDHYV